MKRIFLLFFILLSFSSLSILSYANSDNYIFRTMSPKGGFYYDGVKSVLQDKDGFMWILMDNDLFRFDGYEYKDYYSHFKDIDNSRRWFFNYIRVDSHGNIYVGTNNGLFAFNKLSDTFEKISADLNSNFIIDKKDDIWVTQNNTCGKYNKDSNRIDTLFYKGKPVRFIRYFCRDNKNLYFATQYDRIYKYDYTGDSLTVGLFHLFPRDYAISDVKIINRKLWALVENEGIFKINLETGEIEDRFDFYFNHEDEKIAVKLFQVDKNDKIWIGTQRGLFILDQKTRKYQLHLHSNSNNYSIPNNSIWTISEDSQRNIWIGTFSGGLCYVNPDEKVRFKTYTSLESNLNHNLISGFAEDENSIWIGTEGGGINRWDKKNNSYTYYTHTPHNNSLSYNNVKSLVFDGEKNLWISMFKGGLDCLDTKSGLFSHFKNIKGDKNSLINNNLRKIVLAKDGLWIAYQFNRTVLSFLSFKDKSFTHYNFDEEDTHYYILDVHKDNNNLWIITSKKLYCMDLEKRSVKELSSSFMPSLNAQSLSGDAEGNIWIGTFGNGLIKYDTKDFTFTLFDDILSLNVSTIYSMCLDDDNNLWLGTENGLLRYNIKEDTYLKFDENDGLQGQIYYPLSCMKSKTGELFFGGTNGFTIVNSRNIQVNEFKPKVTISNFFIDNVPTFPAFDEDGDGDNTIILNHNQANFGFQFSSDNYLNPKKNRFKYRLKGYDERWIIVDANNRTALYSKVPPGTYHFEVLAANNDGVWSDIPTVVTIERLPSPWLSWKAYFLYSIIVICIISLILYYYLEKRKLKMQLYIDNLDKQKKEEIHQSQLRFFTNISHDFRTPLSLILATVDNLKQEGLKEYYHRILSNNSQRLLNLVNELMDFRTVENGKLQLQVEPLDINKLVNDLSFDFVDYAKKHNIEFDINCDGQLPQQILADKNIVEKIIMNLLNNAFKYTKDNGRISIETYANRDKFSSMYPNNFTVKSEEEPSGSFLIVIRDSGIGISKESIKNVFERFYKVKTANLDSHLGTGIGLALVKSLVLLHKGSITIFSEREKGTDMVICLSTDPTLYNESEYLSKEKDSDKMIEANALLAEDTDKKIKVIDNMDEVFLREKKRILIVEDNLDLRKLISNFLSLHYEIKEASDGVEASDILNETEIDLIISDIMMPLKDGVTLCREVKNDINTSHIPFILLTAKTGIEAKLGGVDSGADIYFEKPIDFSLLLLSIQNVFKHQQKLREYYSKNYYVDSAELSANEHDNTFLKKLIEIIDININQPNIDVNYIASELSMSRSKLYLKVKTLTDKSIVEFILNYRLRKAARLIIEQDMSMRQVMDMIGIKSQSYFTSVFKKEFGDTPAVFASKNKGKKSQ